MGDQDSLTLEDTSERAHIDHGRVDYRHAVGRGQLQYSEARVVGGFAVELRVEGIDLALAKIRNQAGERCVVGYEHGAISSIRYLVRHDGSPVVATCTVVVSAQRWNPAAAASSAAG